jgi:DNA-binding transcriptional LysR family regulator
VKLDGIAVFVAVAEAGSISEAARRLRLSKSVVSERLAELERGLGARLLQRTTRGSRSPWRSTIGGWMPPEVPA